MTMDGAARPWLLLPRMDQPGAPAPDLSLSGASGASRFGPARRLGVLFVLYFVQGLPFGFQVSALPVYLREAGISLTAIGFAGALSLPWMLKVLWAPAVDRVRWRRLGRRRTWLLPMQAALALACAAAAFAEPHTDLWTLLGLVLCMNLFAATMDIAVDGLAIDTLAPQHLGYGNIAQVVGYKLGMLTAGGALLAASETIGWQGMFAVMAALVLAGFAVTWRMREPPAAEAPQAIGQVLGLARRALRTRAAGWLLLFIATYKLGESMADVLFKPFLVDAGFSRVQIGLWVSTYGMVASLAGSLAGGILASRAGLLRAVAITAALRVVPLAGELWLTLTPPTAGGVIAVTVAEHFFGGALTTAMFAFMMSQVDRRIGATHFTLFATVEVAGKSTSGWLSGLVADTAGYPFVFGLAVLLSVAFLGLLWPVTRAACPARAGRPRCSARRPGR